MRLVAGALTTPAPDPSPGVHVSVCVHALGEQMPLIQLFDMSVCTLWGSGVLAAPIAASLLPLAGRYGARAVSFQTAQAKNSRRAS